MRHVDRSCTPVHGAAAFRRGTPLALLAGLALAGCPTTNSGNPCDGVGCSSRGFCLADDDRPYCACIPGYHPVRIACLENDPDDPCNGVDCAEHGDCRVVLDAPTCDCDDGYRHLAGEGCADAACDLVCVPADPTDGGGDDGAGDDGTTDDDGTDSGPLDVPPDVEQCANGVDDDGDGATDCADPDCDGDRCADDGMYCGTLFDCHVCRAGGCVVDEPHYDASCAPSCGTVETLCGEPTFCCAAGSTCAGGEATLAYGCGRCCLVGCCDPSEATCDDGLDNDCDTRTDCADSDCNARTCGVDAECRLMRCCSPVAPCAGCDCGTEVDSCGNLYGCGSCGGGTCVEDCRCEW